MNIEQTNKGDLIVSHKDVTSREDSIFAREVVDRWSFSPTIAEAAGRLLSALDGHKFRGDRAPEIKEAIEKMAYHVDNWTAGSSRFSERMRAEIHRQFKENFGGEYAAVDPDITQEGPILPLNSDESQA